MTNWPANARNTPRQKISSECWPQQDRRQQKRRFQARPIPRHEPHGHRRQREEMRKAQHVEIGLVDRIHQIAQPVRHETLERLGNTSVIAMTNANNR